MDVLMPKMDGITSLRRLHANNPNIKVLALLPSYQDHESVHAMLENGGTGYISKSSLAEDLIEIIRATYYGNPIP
jgi:DNA-binding NarL/FixJ family response regulator